MVKKVDSAKSTHVSLTDAKQHLGELVKRAAYGGERIVIEFRGRPVAQLIAHSETEEVSAPNIVREVPTRYGTATLILPADHFERMREAGERMAALRERIRAESGIQPDSVEIIREMREERDRQLAGE
ncbi:MAG: type II toxin-antitoxin system Phd/YefM family antitoxin [Chloroflexota bacterium]